MRASGPSGSAVYNKILYIALVVFQNYQYTVQCRVLDEAEKQKINNQERIAVQERQISEKDALDMENKLIVQTEKNLAKDDLYHLWYIAKSYYDGAGAQEHFLFGEEHSLEYYRRAKFYFESYLDVFHILCKKNTPEYTDSYACRTQNHLSYDIHKFLILI